jgi:UDPglucose--hexose-1-phosphate uridylyltransferase
VIAPARARRPGVERPTIGEPTQSELDECPFCEGREDRTPPETYALGPPGRLPDTPGWQVRVVPNLYPALERQEVVVHTPRHARSLAELEESEVEAVATVWHARRQAAAADGFAYVQVVLNEGRVAGSSLPHSHSQLFWLREPPPAVLEELPRLEQGRCGVCDVLLEERLEIALRGNVVAVVTPAGRAPYELVIAPSRHTAEPTDEDLVDAALLLRDSIRRLHEAEDQAPLNAWLHTGGHWHLELVPRLTVFAGLELGAGIYVNSLPPEEAAQRLRA